VGGPRRANYRRVNLVTALNTLTLTQSALMGLSESAEVVSRSCGVTGIIFGAVSAVIGLRMAAAKPPAPRPPSPANKNGAEHGHMEE